MNHEPTFLEIFLTKLAFFLCGRSVYQSFAGRLPLNGEERVLDFGCGMGTVAYYVAKKLPRGQLICLDISKRWMSVCRKTLRGYGNVAFVLCDSLHLPEESFDVAYCHFVLHDISQSKLEIVIPELTKSIKPGGILAFREPLGDTDKISVIKRLMEQNGLLHKESRIVDIPIMGNTLESVYVKGGLL